MQKSNLGKINLGKIQYFIDQKSINITDTINLNLLKKTKIINKKPSKLKVLGSGEVKQKINIEADFFSKSAKEKLEKAGGTAQIIKK